jgi:hypothetical protein
MDLFNHGLPEPKAFDAAQSRDLEWAVWDGATKPMSLPRHIRARNCGYVPPPDPGNAATNAATNSATE